MKRREFLAGMTTAAAIPLMPTKVLASTLGSTQVPDLYAKAAEWAGMWEHSSAPMLKYQFGLDDAGARGLFDRLVKNQIISAPDARGMSKVMVSTYDKTFVSARLSEILSREQTAASVEPAHKAAPRQVTEAPRAEIQKIDMKSKILDDEPEGEVAEIEDELLLDIDDEDGDLNHEKT